MAMSTDVSRSPRQPAHPGRLKRVLISIAILVVSLALSAVILYFLHRYHISLSENAWVAYGSIFLIAVVVNFSFVPSPLAVSIMVAASTSLHPWLVALAGSLGASLGEMNGYYVGFLGKKLVIADEMPGYQRIQGWITKHGMWAIAVLSFQPVIPFEIGGIVAGVARMPIRKFLPALWLGKFPKYLILIYGSLGVIHLFTAR
jgi:membrane protein YqaA with SNARE-associated domain